MSDELVQTILGWWFLGTILLITLIDVIALFNDKPTITVSFWLWELGRRWPALYLLLGIGIGHIVLPLTIRNGH